MIEIFVSHVILLSLKLFQVLSLYQFLGRFFHLLDYLVALHRDIFSSCSLTCLKMSEVSKIGRKSSSFTSSDSQNPYLVHILCSYIRDTCTFLSLSPVYTQSSNMRSEAFSLFIIIGFTSRFYYNHTSLYTHLLAQYKFDI